jgi:hypothetical protein
MLSMLFSEWNAESEPRGDLASAWAWVPLGYDTVLFALTLNRTLPSIHNKEAGHIVHTLFINGVLFYRYAPRSNNFRLSYDSI